MAFTIHPDPHHVQEPDGTWDKRGHPLDGLKAVGLPADHPHYVEVDCSTGRVGWTRLTAEEAAKESARAAAAVAALAALDAKASERLRVIAARARTDSGFAALLEHLGVDLP